MDIRIGFKNNQRELTLVAGDNRDELMGTISQSLHGDQKFFELTDAKGHSFFVNPAEVAYVEVASATRPTVGFGGA